MRAATSSDWESGKKVPDAFTLAKLAEVFGVTTDYLLGIEAARTLPRPESSQDVTLEPIGDEERVQLMGMLAGVTQALAKGLEQKPGQRLETRPDKPTDEQGEADAFSEEGEPQELPGEVPPTGTDG